MISDNMQLPGSYIALISRVSKPILAARSAALQFYVLKLSPPPFWFPEQSSKSFALLLS